MISDEELAAIRERVNRATPGPFSIERRDDDYGSINYIIHGERDFAWCKDELDRRAKFNADFIAHARTDLPRLLEAYEQLSADYDQVIADRDGVPSPELAAVMLSMDELHAKYHERRVSGEMVPAQEVLDDLVYLMSKSEIDTEKNERLREALRDAVGVLEVYADPCSWKSDFSITTNLVVEAFLGGPFGNEKAQACLLRIAPLLEAK